MYVCAVKHNSDYCKLKLPAIQLYVRHTMSTHGDDCNLQLKTVFQFAIMCCVESYGDHTGDLI